MEGATGAGSELAALPSEPVDNPHSPLFSEQYQEAELPDDAASEDEAYGDARANDRLCAECDDGGDMLLCDGVCMRSFHVNEVCNSMGMSDDLYQKIVNAPQEPFICPNCLCQKQQCFVCKRHGRAASDATGSAKVFRCGAVSCGRHYHPDCLELTTDDMTNFLCPLHVCNQQDCDMPNGKEGTDAEIIPCRRCAVAYHRAHIPEAILAPQDGLIRSWFVKYDDQGHVAADTEVEVSIIYCEDHPFLTEWEQTTLVPRKLDPDGELFTLFPPDQLLKWNLHMAQKFSSPTAIASASVQVPAERAWSDDDEPLLFRAKRKLDKAMVAPTRTSEVPCSVDKKPRLRRVSDVGQPSTSSPEGGAHVAPASVAAVRQKVYIAPLVVPSTRVDVATSAAAVELLVTPHLTVGSAHSEAARPSRSLEPAMDTDGVIAPSLAEIPPSHAAETAAGAEQGISSPQAAIIEEEQAQPKVKSQQSQRQKSEQQEKNHQDTGQQGTKQQAPGQGEPEQQELGHQDSPQPEQLAVRESAVVVVPDTLSHVIPASAWSDPGQVRLSEYDAASLLASLPQDSMTTEQELVDVLTKAELALPRDVFRKQNIRKVAGYADTIRHTDISMVSVFERGVETAVKNPGQARDALSVQVLKQMARAQDDMRITMAPHLHSARYSSFGRHFSNRQLLYAIANVLEQYMRPYDCIVDFSCGANDFVPIVKDVCFANGYEISGRAFDIFTASDLEDFERKSWFDCRSDDLPPGERLVIGLNPPFGKQNTLADKFVVHAAETFEARVIVLIAPPRTIIPNRYTVVFEDNSMARDRAFYVPGAAAQSWNVESPPLRIMFRDGHVDPHNGRDHAVLDDCASLGLHNIVPGSAVCGDTNPHCYKSQLGQLDQVDQGAYEYGQERPHGVPAYQHAPDVPVDHLPDWHPPVDCVHALPDWQPVDHGQLPMWGYGDDPQPPAPPSLPYGMDDPLRWDQQPAGGGKKQKKRQKRGTAALGRPGGHTTPVKGGRDASGSVGRAAPGKGGLGAPGSAGRGKRAERRWRNKAN